MSRRPFRSGVDAASASLSTKATESTQWRKYRNPKSRHSYAAEDANALYDRLHGHKVVKTGESNDPDGPDRIVDGVRIQTKFCKDAASTIHTSFNKHTGMYRYNGQVLEVPKDQYEEAVKLMAQKISEGKVEGVTDPAQASKMVKASPYTYKQSVRIAKAGNLDSIKFDVMNQAGASLKSGAISTVTSFVDAKMRGESTVTALKSSAKQGACTAGKTMVTGVATQQILRTGAGRTVSAAAQKGIGKAIDATMKTQAGRKVIEKTASAIGGKAVSGAAAKQVLSRAGSTNVITAAVSFVVSAVPDTVRLCRNKISGKEYAIRTASNGAGLAGGTGGAWVGSAIGTAICPGIGTAVGGFVGSMVGGIGGSSLVSRLCRR